MELKYLNLEIFEKNHSENKLILKDNGIIILENNIEVSDILKTVNPKKIELLIKSGIIKSENCIKKLSDICIFEINHIKNFLNICLEENVIDIINSENISYFYDILSNFNSFQFRNYLKGITKDDLKLLINNEFKEKDLNTVLNYNNLPLLIKDRLKNSTELNQNKYITTAKKITHSKVFSIINQPINLNINSNTNRGFKYEDKDGRSFYDINDKTEGDIGISKSKQLIVNRIFSPFINSTHLLKINGNNKKNTIVSIDVENEDFNNINELKNNGISDDFLKFQGLLYQYFTLDSDRNLSESNETSNYVNKILIDFDRIKINKSKNSKFYDLEYINDKNNFNFSDKEINDITEMIAFFKTYIIALANEKLESKLSDSEKKIWENLKYRAKKISGLNLLLSGFYYIYVPDIEIISQIDKDIIKKYEEN